MAFICGGYQRLSPRGVFVTPMGLAWRETTSFWGLLYQLSPHAMAITVLFFRKLHCERLSNIIQRWFADFTGKCCSIITFICILCRLLFVLLFFVLAIVLSVLRWFPASDYPFGIFKLLNFALSVLLRFTASHYYPFGIFNLFLNNSRLRNTLLIHHGLIMYAPSEGYSRCHQ